MKIGTMKRMMLTMSYNKQDIVLVPFPFSDKPGFKKRPAVIISSDKHYKQYGKYVCLAITSQEKKTGKDRFEHKLYKTKSVGLLYEDQWVLPNKIFTIEESLIDQKRGVMDAADFTTAESMFHAVLPEYMKIEMFTGTVLMHLFGGARTVPVYILLGHHETNDNPSYLYRLRQELFKVHLIEFFVKKLIKFSV
jgi:mRNA interferase MazF